MQKRLLTVALSSAFMSGCGTVTKNAEPVQGDVKSNAGYLADASGNVIKSGYGGCLYNGSWSEADTINVCEGIEEPAPTPVVAAEPPKQEVAEPVAEEQAPVIETVVLNSRAFFGLDADTLSAKGDKAMQNLISKLGDFSKIEKIEIIGHTDDQGSEAYNQQLSERRAETIKSFIIGEYTDTEIKATGMGELDPAATNATAEGRQLNRRVEIRVTAKQIKTNT